MNMKKIVYFRILLGGLIAVIFIIIYLIWGISSAIKISTNVNKLIFTSLNSAVLQTVHQLPRSNEGIVNDFKANKQDVQKIFQMNNEINHRLGFVKSLPVSKFLYSADPQIMGPSVLKVNLRWTYTVYRLGWPLARYSQVDELILEHASNGSIWSLNQSGVVINRS